MALLNRLENDRSLAGFAGQFVPLKIVTDGNPQWSQWARRYPVDGNGIPRLYVVRADGEKLFAAVGSLPGDRLPQMMLATLKQAGRPFNNVETQLLEQAVSAAQTELDDGDFLAASIALSSAAKVGALDDLGSYAKPAILAGELYEKIQAEIDAKAEQARQELSSSDNEAPFDALLVLSEANAAYQQFPSLKAEAAAITRDLRKNKEYSEPLAQAEALVKARSVSSSSTASIRNRAVGMYSAVIRRYPGTRADELARAELAEIDPDAKILLANNEPPPTSSSTTTEPDTSEPANRFRQWTARSGNFQTKAKYIQQKAGKVQLLKEDGKKIVVDISVLSDEDQTFLRQQL